MGFIEGVKSRPISTEGGAPTNGVDMEQTYVMSPNNASGGTFTFRFQGFTTAPIAFNANAAAIQAALELLNSIDSGDIVVSGGPFPASSVVVAFQGNLARKALPKFTSDPSLLTGPGAPYAINAPPDVDGVDSFLRGSGAGALAFDPDTGIKYINTGAEFVTAWTVIGTQI